MADDRKFDPCAGARRPSPRRPPVRAAHQPGAPTIVKDLDVWNVAAVVAAGVDIVHLHFGFETRSPDELAGWAVDLRRCGVALVHTVHDLANPHLVDQACFDEQLATIVRHADALLTLTEWTADAVAERLRPPTERHRSSARRRAGRHRPATGDADERAVARTSMRRRCDRTSTST